MVDGEVGSEHRVEKAEIVELEKGGFDDVLPGGSKVGDGQVRHECSVIG